MEKTNTHAPTHTHTHTHIHIHTYAAEAAITHAVSLRPKGGNCRDGMEVGRGSVSGSGRGRIRERALKLEVNP